MLEQAPLASSPLKPITRLLVSVNNCTRQWIVIGVEDVVLVDACVLLMKPFVELVGTVVESVFPAKVHTGPFWFRDSLTGAPHTGVIASMGCPW